jgi:hypothetical protein
VSKFILDRDYKKAHVTGHVTGHMTGNMIVEDFYSDVNKEKLYKSTEGIHGTPTLKLGLA